MTSATSLRFPRVPIWESREGLARDWAFMSEGTLVAYADGRWSILLSGSSHSGIEDSQEKAKARALRVYEALFSPLGAP